MCFVKHFRSIILVITTAAWNTPLLAQDSVKLDDNPRSTVYAAYSFLPKHQALGYKYRLNDDWRFGVEGFARKLVYGENVIGTSAAHEAYEPIIRLEEPKGSIQYLHGYGQYFFSRRGYLKFLLGYSQAHYQYTHQDVDTRATLDSSHRLQAISLGMGLGHEWHIGRFYFGFDWIRLEKSFEHYKENDKLSGPASEELFYEARKARDRMRESTLMDYPIGVKSLIHLGFNF